MYEEISYTGKTLYEYNQSGKVKLADNTNKIISINNNSISTNIQTLVSNGFLNGTSNECTGTSCSNKNKMIISDPKTKEDIGGCKIVIKKITNTTTGKVSYTVEKDTTETNTNCPNSYTKDVK